MSRFRALDPKAPVDDDVRALMADIDASLADLERRIDESRQRHGEHEEAPSAANSPAAAAAPDSPPAVVPAEAAAATGSRATPDAGSDFLSSLEREAAEKSGSDQLDAIDRAARARCLDEALARIFSFFHRFCRHANALAPQIARPYRLDALTAFPDPVWRDASVRARRQDIAETALYDYVAFRATLASPAPVTVVRNRSQMETLKKDIHVLDLRPATELDVDVEAPDGRIQLRLAPDFPLQVTFRANYDKGRIDVLSRNLEGFGIAAFVCSPGDVTQQFLDDLGRYLIGRGRKLPGALQYVQFRSEL